MHPLKKIIFLSKIPWVHQILIEKSVGSQEPALTPALSCKYLKTKLHPKGLQSHNAQQSYLHNYLNIHVCPSLLCRHWRPIPLPNPGLVSYYKTLIINLTWYVLRVIKMHSWSPSGPWGPISEKKMSYVHYINRGGKAILRISKLTSVDNHLPSVSNKRFFATAHLGYTGP